MQYEGRMEKEDQRLTSTAGQSSSGIRIYLLRRTVIQSVGSTQKKKPYSHWIDST